MLGVMSKQQDEMLRSFGRRFQLLRQDKDLSQTAIAAMLQGYGITITPSHLSLVEKNKRNVSVDLLVALARLLETSTDYLLVLTDDPSPPDKSDVVPYLSREADDMAQLMDSLPPETRRMLLSAAHAWVAHERQRIADEWVSLLSAIERSVGRDKRREIEAALMRDGAIPAMLTGGIGWNGTGTDAD